MTFTPVPWPARSRAVVPVAAVAAAVVPGHTFRVVADGASTSGAFSLTEATSPTGASVPPHAHDEAVECFYVLDGRYRFTVSGRVHEVGPGGFSLVPRGAAHQFEVVEGEARAVVLFTPAGFEEVFRRMPAIFGTAGEPGPLWEAANARAATRLLSGQLPGPAAVVRREPPPGLHQLADPAITATRLRVSLLTGPEGGRRVDVGARAAAAYVLAGGYRFEHRDSAVAAESGHYLPLPGHAGPVLATAVAPGSRTLLISLEEQ